MRLPLSGIALLAVLVAPQGAMGATVVVGDREWRQVTDTVNTSWNAFAASCDVSTGACAGVYSGWTWASASDVQALWTTLTGVAQLSSSSYVQQFDSPWAPQILSSFDSTYADSSSSRIYGLVRETTGSSNEFGRILEVSDWHSPSHIDVAWADGYLSPGAVNPYVGAWMYAGITAPVPEPGIYAMLGLGLCLAGWAGRRRRAASS